MRRSIFSIRWIVAGAVAVLTTLVVLGVTGVMERKTRSVLMEEIESRLLIQSRNLAVAGANALLTEYPELLLAPMVKEMRAEQPELALVVVVDRSGTIQGDSDVRRIGTPFAMPTHLTPVVSTVTRKQDELLSENLDMLLVSAPIRDLTGRQLGNALVGVRRSHIDEAVDRVGREQYLVLAAFLIAGVAASILLLSVLLRPIEVLRAGIERVGRGELGARVELRDRTEFGLLADAINDMSTRLEKAQGEIVERARLAHEMDLARQIQRSLLPSKQTVAGEFVIDGEQWAAAEVGGDYFDVLSLPDGKIGLAIADVSGKGLAGCLVTSMLFSLLRAFSSAHASPASLLAALDERLGGILQRGAFVTMFYGVLDPETGRLVHSSAGHNPTLIARSDGRSEWLYSKGIPLGAIRGGAIRRTLEDGVLDLQPGDVLLQFTDGINETQAPSSQEQFGFDRMERAVREAAPSGARAVLEQLHRTVDSWRGSTAREDDETVLVVSREGRLGAIARPGTAAPGAPLGRLEQAKAVGVCLRVPADLDSMGGIVGWLEKSGIVRGSDETEAGLLNLALYEVCANIAEHGYGQDGKSMIEVWWLSEDGSGSGAGSFLIRDHGKPFRPDAWKGTDFNDPQVRKLGRGLGLEIIHRVMKHVAYYPGTEVGNITVLEWDPAKELRHAS